MKVRPRDLGPEFVKLRLTAPDGTVETPWAIDLGDQRFKVDNIPFYAYGVSTDDIVVAVPQDDGVLAFVKVLEASGNRTLRVIFKDKVTTTVPLLQRLSDMGVSWEGSFGRLFGLNVPPEVDLVSVAALLTESGLDWEYANPTWDQLHPDGDS
jgi:uncharacterized protein DUF4265